MKHRFFLPDSVVCTCSLDDPAMQREMGVAVVGTNYTGKRTVYEGTDTAFICVVDTCLLMDADHGAEDASMGTTYTRNAGRWAKRQAADLLARGMAKRSPYGGIMAV